MRPRFQVFLSAATSNAARQASRSERGGVERFAIWLILGLRNFSQRDVLAEPK